MTTMKKAQVQIGGRYIVRLSGKFTTVRIQQVSPFGGWTAINENTGRTIRIKSAAKLRGEVR